MSEPNEELVLDRLIHEPGRLAILNLSSHLTKLEEAGLVQIEKRFVLKKPNTNVELTKVGRERISDHWSQLDRLKNLAQPQIQE
jgi:DNA-binding MarR family transcriptional regulator